MTDAFLNEGLKEVLQNAIKAAGDAVEMLQTVKSGSLN
jgi:hypothetical protein